MGVGALVGILAAVVNVAKLLTLFQRTGGLAPNGSLSVLFVIPIWVWSIAVGVILIRTPASEATSASTGGMAGPS